MFFVPKGGLIVGRSTRTNVIEMPKGRSLVYFHRYGSRSMGHLYLWNQARRIERRCQAWLCVRFATDP